VTPQKEKTGNHQTDNISGKKKGRRTRKTGCMDL